MFLAAETLSTARHSAALSIRDLATRAGRSISTVSRIETGSSDPSTALLAELLEHCDWRLIAEPTDPIRTKRKQSPMPSAPSTYPNPRNNDPWDNDTVHWLVTQPGVGTTWKHGPLFECLRRQAGRVRNEPHRVDQAGRLAARFGVEQRVVYDPAIGKEVVRLIRTDPSAPKYPW